MVALINLGDIMLSEIRQTQVDKYYLKYGCQESGSLKKQRIECDNGRGHWRGTD